MRNNKFGGLLMAAMFTLAAMPAFGQFDFFGQPRTLVVATPKILSGAAVGLSTNAAVDVHMFKGVVKLDLFSCTNANAGTMTVTVETSPDTNTWTTLANYALATSTTINYTNAANTNYVAANTWLLPGTVTTPTAATAGWATPYLLTSPFTNTGAITLNGGGVSSIGFKVDDVGRYLHVIWAPAGSATNISVGAVLTGRAFYVP
jgi:hypothetical protein